MENNGKLFLKLKKFLLCSIITKKEESQITEGQIIKLLSNYNDILEILKFKSLEGIKNIYFYRENIDNILYDEEKSIIIECHDNNNNNDNNINLSYIFYLSLLIDENKNMINYLYSFDYIRNIYKNNIQNNSNNKYKLIMIFKIIIELISNYRNTDLYDEERDEKELNEIKEESKRKINENIKYINSKINVENEIIKKKIDQIYIDIIKSLIIEGKLEQYEFIENIIKQLEFDNINITKLMFEEISKILNSNENNIKEYIILQEKDLYVEKKINFYFILLKYIFKNSIFIYHIPILFKTRKLILNTLKSNKLSYNEKNENLKRKFEYIIKKLVDSDFYFKIIPESDINKLKEVLDYYNNFLFQTKKEDINIINNIIENKKGYNYKKYLMSYEESTYINKINKRASIIKYLFNKINNNKNIDNEEKEINKYIEIWNNIENNIKKKTINNLDKNIKLILLEYFQNKDNKNILMNIFTEEEFVYFNKERELLNENNKSKENNKENKIDKESNKSDKNTNQIAKESNNKSNLQKEESQDYQIGGIIKINDKNDDKKNNLSNNKNENSSKSITTKSTYSLNYIDSNNSSHRSLGNASNQFVDVENEMIILDNIKEKKKKIKYFKKINIKNTINSNKKNEINSNFSKKKSDISSDNNNNNEFLNLKKEIEKNSN